jgi:hypothetical protein
MLDEFRQQADSSPFFEEEEEFDAEEVLKPRLPEKRFLGMTAAQRFVIAIMLLLAACILSSTILLVTGRVIVPFF